MKISKRVQHCMLYHNYVCLPSLMKFCTKYEHYNDLDAVRKLVTSFHSASDPFI